MSAAYLVCACTEEASSVWKNAYMCVVSCLEPAHAQQVPTVHMFSSIYRSCSLVYTSVVYADIFPAACRLCLQTDCETAREQSSGGGISSVFPAHPLLMAE